MYMSIFKKQTICYKIEVFQYCKTHFSFSSPGQSPWKAIVTAPGVIVGVGVRKMLRFLH